MPTVSELLTNAEGDMALILGYTADVLTSAQSLADHAARSGPSRIEKEDVELAIQMRRRYEFFEPPPRDVGQRLAGIP